MEDRETARMRKYGESKTTRIMMATVPHVNSDLGLRKFQADGFLLTRVYIKTDFVCVNLITLDISVRRISHKPFLPSQVLTENKLTESYRTIIVPVITYRSENCCITLQEENRLKVLKIRSIKNHFGPSR